MALVYFTGCSQWVHVKAPKVATQVILQNKSVPVYNGRAWVQVAPGVRSVPYQVVNARGELLAWGDLERTKPDPWVIGMSVGGAMVAAPLLVWVGVNIANPSWAGVFAYTDKRKKEDGLHVDLTPYLRQTLSMNTLPIAAAFGAVGLLPFLGLLFAGKLPDGVVLGGP